MLDLELPLKPYAQPQSPNSYQHASITPASPSWPPPSRLLCRFGCRHPNSLNTHFIRSSHYFAGKRLGVSHRVIYTTPFARQPFLLFVETRGVRVHKLWPTVC